MGVWSAWSLEYIRVFFLIKNWSLSLHLNSWFCFQYHLIGQASYPVNQNSALPRYFLCPSMSVCLLIVTLSASTASLSGSLCCERFYYLQGKPEAALSSNPSFSFNIRKKKKRKSQKNIYVSAAASGKQVSWWIGCHGSEETLRCGCRVSLQPHSHMGWNNWTIVMELQPHKN